MRVLHVYRTYFPSTQGGLEEVIRQICKNTKELGVESRVFYLTETPSENPIHREEADVFTSKKHLELASCSISFTAFRQFDQLVDWADLIHYHFPWPFADFLHFALRVKKPSIITYHSDIVRQRGLLSLYNPLMHRFLNAVNRIICTSPNYFVTSDILTRYQDKVEVIPIGLDESHYLNDTVSDMNNTDLDQTPFFLFIGVLRYYKGLHILLEAMQDAPFKVVIVGSGPTERDLKQQATRLGLDNTIFAGQISDSEKVNLLKKARGIVFPSYLRSEAFGVTLLEGAMFSKPLISAEVGSGTSHVNIHGQTGFVVAPGLAKALRKAMYMLFEDDELAVKFGRAARKRYEALFTGKLMGDRYFEIYKNVLVTTPSSGAAESN